MLRLAIVLSLGKRGWRQAVVPVHLAGGFLEKGLCGSSLVTFLDLQVLGQGSDSDRKVLQSSSQWKLMKSI